MVRVLIAGLVAMVIAVVIGPQFIEWLRRQAVGQQIREEGPQHHIVKQGTPTMGGLLIIFSALLPFFVVTLYTTPAEIYRALIEATAGGSAVSLAKVSCGRSTQSSPERPASCNLPERSSCSVEPEFRPNRASRTFGDLTVYGPAWIPTTSRLTATYRTPRCGNGHG